MPIPTVGLSLIYQVGLNIPHSRSLETLPNDHFPYLKQPGRLGLDGFGESRVGNHGQIDNNSWT
jgi:hypothetical protein